MEQVPWVAVEDVCHVFSLKYTTAKNKISDGTFPVPVYRVGKRWVIDRLTFERYFAIKREASLEELGRRMARSLKE
jgi:hypothetical protein